jgi:hypothetical protein
MFASRRRDRRAHLLATVAGVLSVVVGLAGITRVVVKTSEVTQLLGISQTVLLIGVMLLGRYGSGQVAIDEAYRLGYDLGMENGVEQERQRSKPVVVNLNPGDHIRQKPE